jgi:hypothetical protein
MSKRYLAPAVIVIVAFVGGIAARSGLNSSRLKHPAYTITWQATDYDADGTATPLYSVTKYVSSSGNWRSVRHYPDGTVEETFAEVGRGTFAKRGQKLHYLSGASGGRAVTAEGLLKSPDFLRTETVLGQQAIVVKAAGEKSDSPVRAEFYCAPALGGDDIKVVLRRGEKTLMEEPVSLVFGEPDPSLLKASENLPVDYEHFRKLHGQPRPR